LGTPSLELVHTPIDKTEVFATKGVYEIRPEPIAVKREFIVIVARKPSSTVINTA
jgi:hypothetical protein